MGTGQGADVFWMKQDMKIECSNVIQDPEWDQFVEAHPQGLFQQSGMWAEAKSAERWEVRRTVVREGDRIIAGAQILEKATRFGKMGLINKGPLVIEGREDALNAVLEALVKIQKSVGYLALMAHPPDGGDAILPSLGRFGFVQESLLPIISSTLLIDLSPGWEKVHAGFRRTTRREIRQSTERGVVIVEGTAADTADFFSLMESTCERQGTRPNPGTLKATVKLVDAFARRGKARIWFAVREGRRIAAGLALLHGNRVNFWKKGWDQTAHEAHANTLTTADIIRWGAERQFRWLDFASLDRDTAEAMTAGTQVPKDLSNRRDFFNLGFGGQALLMPPCMVRFRNAMLRVAYRVGTLGPLRKSARRSLAVAGLSG